MSAEPLTGLAPTLSESETKRYSDYEVDLLIDDLTEAALEAIEQAAGEAAKAAVSSMVEREAAALQAQAMALREMQRWKNESEIQLLNVSQVKKAGIKNAIIASFVCLVCGSIAGITGTLIIQGR